MENYFVLFQLYLKNVKIKKNLHNFIKIMLQNYFQITENLF